MKKEKEIEEVVVDIPDPKGLQVSVKKVGAL